MANLFREPRRTANLDAWYRKNLKKIAKSVDLIAKQYRDETDPRAMASAIQRSLFSYAEQLDGWAMAVSATMLKRASQADYDVWVHSAKTLSRETRRKLKQAGVGDVFTQLQAEQVQLIKSLPLEAAMQVHDWMSKGLARGERSLDIAKRIQSELGGVTESRAVLIARTESARARTSFTKVRAKAVGSTHYRWHTVGDSRTRQSHAQLNNTIHAWDSPPITDYDSKGNPLRAHPGCIWSCRCWCEPIFDED